MKTKKSLTKKFLNVNVTRNDGSSFINPLKLSEAHLLSKMAQENKCLVVTLSTASESAFKAIFG